MINYNNIEIELVTRGYAVTWGDNLYVDGWEVPIDVVVEASDNYSDIGESCDYIIGRLMDVLEDMGERL